MQREPTKLFKYSKKRGAYQYSAKSHIFIHIGSRQKAMLLFAHIVKMLGAGVEDNLTVPGQGYDYNVFYSTIHKGVYIELHVGDTQVTSVKLYITKRMLLGQCRHFAKVAPDKKESTEKLQTYIEQAIDKDLGRYTKKRLQKKEKTVR